MFSTQNMQNEKSIAEEIESLTSEPKPDNAGLIDLPLLSPSDFDFLPTETIAEGTVKTALPPPPNSLKTTPYRPSDLIHHPSNNLINSKRLLLVFKNHYADNERTKRLPTDIPSLEIPEFNSIYIIF